MRHVDDEAAGQRDLGREPRALRLHRVLDRLDEDLLAALDQILDLARPLAALELGPDDLVDVEEAVLLEPDLDERGLHARQDVVDDAEVDVAGDRAALGTLEVHLGDPVVLEHGDALLAGVDGDEKLALRLRQRGALRRRATARLASSAPCARTACASRRAAAAPRCGRLGAARAVGRRGGGLLLAVAPAARSAAPLRGGGGPAACGALGSAFGPAAVGRRVDGLTSTCWSVSPARSGRASTSGLRRRNQGSGKRSLLNRARAGAREPRGADGWEKPWHGLVPGYQRGLPGRLGRFGRRAGASPAARGSREGAARAATTPTARPRRTASLDCPRSASRYSNQASASSMSSSSNAS